MTLSARGFLPLAALLGACGSSPSDDSGAPTSSDASTDQQASGPDGAATSDAASEGDAATPDGSTDGATPQNDAATCSPTPGAAVEMDNCDQIELAILQNGAATPTVSLIGRTNASLSTSANCELVDSIDVQSSTLLEDGGYPDIATLTGVPGNVLTDGSTNLLGTGTATATLAAMCNSDSNRFDAIGVTIHGRINGGTFVSTCGTSNPGSSTWPPSIVVLCESGTPGPLGPGDGEVMVFSVMGTTSVSTTVSVAFPQPPTFATFGSTMHLIPQVPPFSTEPPIAPSDSTGWTGYASSEQGADGTTDSEVEMFGADALGSTLCPQCTTTPCPLSPAFIARITGTTNQGAFTSELFVGECFRSLMMAP